MTRRGDWQHVYTGRQFWPLDPRVEDLDIRDIAHALSLQCRFGGHCRRHYSIAEHSVLVLDLLQQSTSGEAFDPELSFAALLHDASEAYLVDIPQPVKPALANYEEIENRLMQAVGAKWGFVWPLDPRVKAADEMALAIEKHALFGLEPAPWKPLPEPTPYDLPRVGLQDRPMAEVEEEFLWQFYRLCERAGVSL